uniref:PQQ-dependent sugar dehydrogenase n=1 Tax=Desertifilum tharense IPPAS B-1220 TaxID=1781255 RepID=A0ACD5GU03_9CYAN
MLYLSVGSTCNACEEPNEEHATLLRAQADGSNRSIYARGLRNTIGFGWHPVTGELWGMDHGSDWRGEDQPPKNSTAFNRVDIMAVAILLGRSPTGCFSPRQP